MVQHVDNGSNVARHADEVNEFELVVVNKGGRHHTKDHQESPHSPNEVEAVVCDGATLFLDGHRPVHLVGLVGPCHLLRVHPGA